MRKFLSIALVSAALAPAAIHADIKVNLPKDAALDSLNYDYTTILNMSKPRAQRGTVSSSVPVKNNQAVVPVSNAEGGTQYTFNLGDRKRFVVYAAPGDEIVTEVTAIDTLDVTTSGTDLYVGINEVDNLVAPIMERYAQMRKQGNLLPEEFQAIVADYNRTLKDYIDENNTQPSAVYAVMQLDGEDFLEYFPKLSERAKTSILFPIAEIQKESTEKSVEKERRQQALEKGNAVAPDFSLLDLDGKEVSLYQFRGKWVILDFWGSWCGWCIKGFPELKEAYTKYKGILEIVGVDCRESEEAWRAGVKKYELPWVNVYNPDGTTLLDEYGVQGFPTKIIIDPEGKIRNITTGHKPDFFNTLSELIGK